MHPFYIVPDIQHYAGEYVKYQRKANGQEGRINEKKPYLTDGNIKTFAQVSANPERVPLKESKNTL